MQCILDARYARHIRDPELLVGKYFMKYLVASWFHTSPTIDVFWFLFALVIRLKINVTMRHIFGTVALATSNNCVVSSKVLLPVFPTSTSLPSPGSHPNPLACCLVDNPTGCMSGSSMQPGYTRQ